MSNDSQQPAAGSGAGKVHYVSLYCRTDTDSHIYYLISCDLTYNIFSIHTNKVYKPVIVNLIFQQLIPTYICVLPAYQQPFGIINSCHI